VVDIFGMHGQSKSRARLAARENDCPAATETAFVSSALGRWTEGTPPSNVRLGSGTLISGELAFKRFFGEDPLALDIGARCTMDGVQFALGRRGKMTIGDFCYFTNAVLLCEQRIEIGRFVVIGWNATIADSDFHPLEPAERIADAIACSPLGGGRTRPPLAACPVIIENDVWIGPNATILKGVKIGAGAWIEPGAVVLRDIPANARVLGNPAVVIGTTG
jgi:acetyltransferase-like isoleucine patch superfamily enzyme